MVVNLPVIWGRESHLDGTKVSSRLTKEEGGGWGDRKYRGISLGGIEDTREHSTSKRVPEGRLPGPLASKKLCARQSAILAMLDISACTS